MTGKGIGTPDRAGNRPTGARALTVVACRASCVAVMLAASGCSHLAGESDAPQARVIGGEQAGPPAASDSYPTLSAVPPRPTGVTTPEERQRLREALIADRANAQYTSDGPVARPTGGVSVPPPGPLPVPGEPPEASRARAVADEAQAVPARQPQAIPTPVPIGDGAAPAPVPVPTPVSAAPAPVPVPVASAPAARQLPPIQTADSMSQPVPVPGPVPQPQPAVMPASPAPESAEDLNQQSLGPSGLPRRPGRIVLVEGPDVRQDRDRTGAPISTGATGSGSSGYGAVPPASSIPVYRGPETSAQPVPQASSVPVVTPASSAVPTPVTVAPSAPSVAQPRLSPSEQAELAAAYQQALGNRSRETGTDPTPVPAPVQAPVAVPVQTATRQPQAAVPQQPQPGRMVTVQDAYQAALNQSAEATLGIRVPNAGGGVAAPAQGGGLPYAQPAQPFVPGFSQPVATIFFGRGGTGLSRADRDVLQQVSLLQAQSQGRVRVVGHASDSGGASANERLSLNRANTVAVALIGMGVPREAILIAGAGEGAQPFGFGAPVPAGPAGERRADVYLEN